MPTAADVKKLALALDGVTEVDHFGRPSYRTRKRLFAVMRPDGLWINVPEERKEFLLEADPKAFVKFMWGKRSNVIVQIDRISSKELTALLHEAWEHSGGAAPVKARAKTKTPAKRPASRKPSIKKKR